MKVFISSLIAGFEPMRQACRSAVSTLRHEPVAAEDFGARPGSPQAACLKGVRDADLVLLVLGERYGSVQSGSGLSATHEEYREARGSKPVLAFVQDGITPDAQQADFIREVQGWESGLFRESFTSPEQLSERVIRALHDYELAHAAGPVDHAALVLRATSLLPRSDRNSSREASVCLGLASGPQRQVLRPAQIKAPALAEAMHQHALFGEHRIFSRSAGNDQSMEGSALVLSRERGSEVRLDEDGAIVLRLPLREADRMRRTHGFSAIIEETVLERILLALGFAGWLLEHIDPQQRITHQARARGQPGLRHREHVWRR